MNEQKRKELNAKLKELKNKAYYELGKGEGYRVEVYGESDWDTPGLPDKAVLNWSATGDQTPETALKFAEALKTLSELAAAYNKEREAAIAEEA